MVHLTSRKEIFDWSLKVLDRIATDPIIMLEAAARPKSGGGLSR
jgi:hypothetical protein